MFTYKGLKRGRERRADREQLLLEARMGHPVSSGQGLGRGVEGESEAAEGRGGAPAACLPCAHTGRTPGPLTPAVSRLPRHSPATRLSITEGFRPLPSSYFLNDQGQIASPRSSEIPS